MNVAPFVIFLKGLNLSIMHNSNVCIIIKNEKFRSCSMFWTMKGGCCSRFLHNPKAISGNGLFLFYISLLLYKRIRFPVSIVVITREVIL